jgi:hypothetical protein
MAVNAKAPASYFQVLDLNFEDDREATKKIIPRGAIDLEKRLPEFHSYWYDVNTATRKHFRHAAAERIMSGNLRAATPEPRRKRRSRKFRCIPSNAKTEDENIKMTLEVTSKTLRAKLHTMDVTHKFIGAQIAVGTFDKMTGPEAAEIIMKAIEGAMAQMAPIPDIPLPGIEALAEIIEIAAAPPEGQK